jgi:hypothetical protein
MNCSICKEPAKNSKKISCKGRVKSFAGLVEVDYKIKKTGLCQSCKSDLFKDVLLNTFIAIKKPIPEHYSSISNFMSCPYKYYLSHIEKLEPIEKPAAISFGHAIHEGRHYYNQNCNNIGFSINEPIEWAEKVFSDIVFPCEPNKLTKNNGLLAKIKTCLYLLLQQDTEHGDSEIEFSDKELNFYGTPDKVVGDTLYEYKTCSEIKQETIRIAKHKLQDRIYAAILTKNGHEIKHIKHFLIKKPQIRIKKDETVEQFKARLFTNSFGKDIIKCVEYDTTPEMLSESIYYLKGILNTIRCTNVFFKNMDACENNYGTCWYYDLCHNNLNIGYKKCQN